VLLGRSMSGPGRTARVKLVERKVQSVFWLGGKARNRSAWRNRMCSYTGDLESGVWIGEEVIFKEKDEVQLGGG
jgi:hypothetical protein